MNKLEKIFFKFKKNIIQKLNIYKIDYAEIRDLNEYNEFCQKHQKTFKLAQNLNEKLKFKINKNENPIYFKFKFKNFKAWIKKCIIHGKIKGICIYCDKIVDFEYYHIEGYDDVLFGNNLICPKCYAFNRTRIMLYLLQKFIGTRKNLKIYCLEQITPFYKQVKNLFEPDSEVIGSEYISPQTPSGTTVNNIRHEDALNLSFKDNYLDFVISNDVYEHVPDIRKTFQEAYRTLKKGGYMIFTAPFSIDKPETITRAKIENGELILFMEKEIHGNPLSKEGSLAFYNFGWDLLQMQKETGFKDPYIIAIIDQKFGHINYSPLLTFVAQKT